MNMDQEYPKRIRELQRRISAAGIDAFIVSARESIYYLCGASFDPVERPFLIVVRPSGLPDLVVPLLELDHMRKAGGFGEIIPYLEYPSLQGQNWYDIINEMLGANAVVGVEPDYALGKSQLLRVKEIVVLPAIEEMRMVKSPAEIEAVRNACRSTDEGMRLLHQGLYEGQSILETTMPSRSLQTNVLKSGDFDFLNSSFLTVGWNAPKSAQPHSVPPLNSRMGKGPLVLMSFNRVNGYAAECERTVFIGDPTPEERRLYDLMNRARELAYTMVRPGVSCHEIDAATREYFRGAGCGNRILHRTGHGIGMGNHEAPWLSAGSSHVLQENMIISIEPGLYFPDIGGFRHSDTVLVTKNSYEVLTEYPSDLGELIVRQKRLMQRIKGAVIRKALNI